MTENDNNVAIKRFGSCAWDLQICGQGLLMCFNGFVHVHVQVNCEPDENIKLRFPKLRMPNTSSEGAISLTAFPVAGSAPLISIDVKPATEPVWLGISCHDWR